jgi:hypothetical protein
MQVFVMFNAIMQYTGTHMKVQLQDTSTQNHNIINMQEEDHVLMATTPQDAQNFAGSIIYSDAAWTNGTGHNSATKSCAQEQKLQGASPNIMCTEAKTTRRITKSCAQEQSTFSSRCLITFRVFFHLDNTLVPGEVHSAKYIDTSQTYL